MATAAPVVNLGGPSLTFVPKMAFRIRLSGVSLPAEEFDINMVDDGIVSSMTTPSITQPPASGLRG